MEAAHLDQLIRLEDSYWWHVAKRNWATNLLTRYVPPPSRIIEGGIGAGGNLLYWQQMGYEVAGLDCMDESVQHASKQGLTNVHLHDLHQPWPVEPASAEAIVLLDVLEHLKHPVLALRNAANCLTATGKIVFTSQSVGTQPLELVYIAGCVRRSIVAQSVSVRCRHGVSECFTVDQSDVDPLC